MHFDYTVSAVLRNFSFKEIIVPAVIAGSIWAIMAINRPVHTAKLAQRFWSRLTMRANEKKRNLVSMKNESNKNPKTNGAGKMNKRYGQLLSLIFAVVFLTLSQASALTIETRLIGGEAPANAVGKGNLKDIVNTAARMWESVYADKVTLTLYYGWDSIGSAGTHTAAEMNSTKNREISGVILVDNSGATKFYLDPTPASNSEYLRNKEEFQNFGGGTLNVARIFSQPIGDAIGRVDLLSVILHEMGHAMGMSLANQSFIAQSNTGVLELGSNLAYTGTLAPLARNNAGVIPHFNAMVVRYGTLMAGLNSDERRLPSELDILANAQVSGYAILSLYPNAQYTLAVSSIQTPAASPAKTTSVRAKKTATAVKSIFAKNKVSIFRK
jgi:hypothetical protein